MSLRAGCLYRVCVVWLVFHHQMRARARTCVVHKNVHSPVLPEHKRLELFYALIAGHVQLVEHQLAHTLFALCHVK